MIKPIGSFDLKKYSYLHYFGFIKLLISRKNNQYMTNSEYNLFPIRN